MSDSHIVPMPKGFIAVRILQIIFAVIVAGLTAFLISNTIGFVFSAIAFGIFCAVLTLIIVTYDLVSERAAKSAYNMWAILALEIVMVIFWLSAMSAMAALRAAFTISIVFKRELIKRYVYAWAGSTYLAILAAAAGVAAIELVLFLISLVMFSIRLHRHRISSKSTSPGASTVHITPEKIELQQNPPQAAYYAPAPAPAPAHPNYQPPALQPQHPGSAAFSPVSPLHTGQAPYQPTMSPPPQFVQAAPQYPVTAPPQGYHEVPVQQGPY